MRKIITINLIIIISLIFSLTGCNLMKDKLQDKTSYDEYKKVMFSGKKDKAKKNDESEIEEQKAATDEEDFDMPDLSPILSEPDIPTAGKNKLVSLSVTDDIPLKDVLMELSRVADIDIELDPKITGGIILKVKNRPFSEIIDRICEIANLRYKTTNGVLRIEQDTPYVVNYSLDFLNLTRSNSSSASVSTSLSSGSSSSGSSSGGSSGGSSSGSSGSSGSGGSSSSGSGSNGNNGGSSSNITSTYDGDLWSSIEKDLRNILIAGELSMSGIQYNSNNSSSRSDSGNSSGSNSNLSSKLNDLSKSTGALEQTQALASVGSAAATALNTTQDPGTSNKSSGQNSEQDVYKQDILKVFFISINKQASMISVFTTHKLHKSVKSYLDRVRESISAQVLIEAKIIEVTLNDNYQTGINWTEIDKKFQSGLGLAGVFSSGITSGTGKIGLGVANKIKPSNWSSTLLNDSSGEIINNQITNSAGDYAGNTLQALVEATQMFGTTKTLSSPRLLATNNQLAVLSFVENQVYFTLSVTSQNSSSSSTSANTTTTSTTPVVTVNSTLNSVPIGVILTFQPSINVATNEITMNIRPTITRTSSSVSDPAVAYITSSIPSAAGLTSTVPVVEVRELDSIVKVKSGQVMVIGGIMEEVTNNTQTGAPYLMSAPIIGNLFKSVSKANTVVQTVIFIKATIIPGENDNSNRDKQIYNNFLDEEEDI